MDNLKSIYLLIISILFLFIFNQISFAHEPWLLTPADFTAWNEKPLPALFHEIGWQNAILTIGALIITIAWIILGNTRVAKWLSKPRQYLSAQTTKAPFLLRIAIAITLFIAAFGIIPREGYARFTVATLFTPDMQLNLISLFWYWLQWIELVIATLFLLGLFTRLSALILLCITLLGFILFDGAMLSYAGFFAGVAIFLLIEGSGDYAAAPETLPIPYLKHLQPLATFILRILTGTNFIYLGIFYKLLHPNLTIGILEIHHAFSFGIPYPTFVFLMALVEIFSGILILTGVMIRALSCILLFLFILLSSLVGENIFAHSFIYGILFVFILNGAGAYRLDKVASELS